MAKPTYDRASDVTPDRGRVQLDGPDHVDVAFTAEAAEETARRIVDAAEQARRQRDQVDGEEGGEPPLDQ